MNESLRARILRAKSAAGGTFLMDEQLKTERQWQWSPEARQLVRDMLDAVPHDVDLSWFPGSVYISVHRDAEPILELEAGYIAVFAQRAPDADAWLREHVATPPYQQPSEAARGGQRWCYTLPGAGGGLLNSSGVRSSAPIQTETCTTCWTAKSVSGACLC